MNNKLLLFSKNGIPFQQAQLIIHNPTISEISFMGSQIFFNGCNYLTFSKQLLSEKDKSLLQKQSDFNILMTMIRQQKVEMAKNRVCIEMVLSLLFPEYSIGFLPQSILLSRKNENNEIERHLIDSNNFESFKDIISEIFCLKKIREKVLTYNPGGPQAAAIARKIEQGKRRVAKQKRQDCKQEEYGILELYISVLSVGLQKDKNDLMQYTIYQLFDQFYRFRKKQEFDVYISAKLAGAKDLEDVQNWII